MLESVLVSILAYFNIVTFSNSVFKLLTLEVITLLPCNPTQTEELGPRRSNLLDRPGTYQICSHE